MNGAGNNANLDKEGIDWKQDQIEVSELLKVVWKYKYLVLIGTLVCAVAAAIIGSNEQPYYIVESTLKLNRIIINTEANPNITSNPVSQNLLTYLDSARNIKSAIELGLLNSEINNYLKKFNNIEITDLSAFSVLILGKENLIKITYRAGSAERGVAVLNSLKPALIQSYASKIKAIQENQHIFGLKKNQDKFALEVQTETLQTDIQNLSLRINELESELNLLDSNIKLMRKQRDDVLLKGDKNDMLSSYLYANTIQQNIALKNTYKNDLFRYRADRDFKKSELKKIESKIKIIQRELKAFESSQESDQYIQVVQHPEKNIKEVHPKMMRKVMMGIAVGFFLMIFLSLFLDYLIKALRKRK